MRSQLGKPLVKLALISSFWLLGFLWLGLAGGSRLWAAEGRLPVAASIIPLGDFCRQIGGERVAVEVLIPPGASPHVYEPPPSKVAQAMTAGLVVYVGAGLDPWMERIVKSRGGQGWMAVKAVQGLPLLHEVEEHDHGPHQGAIQTEDKHQHHEGHHHGEGNPHVWLDPVLAQDICQRIGAALMALDPDHRPFYEANLKAYLAELEKLHTEIATQVAGFRLREYVCFHPAFTYFARRYHLREAGVIELSPGREPTPKHIKRIVETMRRTRARVVFAEPQLSARVAEVIAREAGARVLWLDPLGGRPPYGDDYVALMRYNLNSMAKAMK